MKLTRRDFALGSACAASLSQAATPREISIISAPVSLGLRPGAKGQ